ncbi:ABC transporter permease subunit, partial [Clostridium sp. D2Q-14]|uniref:ABC transporter permease subunit n=1 Tax=Anaeromonas gelatinilytica TaxID=2683194 RepID=UPI00193C1F8B
MINRLKRFNLPLIIGLILVIVVLFIAMYGNRLTNIDPYATNMPLPKVDDGELQAAEPVQEPNSINIWGTDTDGRDVFSRIMYGAKTTIQIGLMTALFRLLIGLSFGFFAGFGDKISSKIIDIFNISFSAIPALVISFILLQFFPMMYVSIESTIFHMVVILTFVGWGRISGILRDRIADILSQDFIKGEIAIGKNKLQIALQNILPHLFSTIIIYYLIEVSRAITIIGELGILGFSMYYAEWGSMLSQGSYALLSWKPWLVIYAAVALFISVLGFNLLGEGLKIELNKRNSKFIIFIKHIPYQLSPRTYIYQIKNRNRFKKSIAIKTTVILLIIIFIIFPETKSQYYVEGEDVYRHLEELSKDKYEGRKIGTEGNDNTREYIVDQLKDMGVKPAFEDGYIQQKELIVNINEIVDTNLYIETENEDINFQFQKDYNFDSVFLDKTSDTMYGGKLRRRILNYESYEQSKYDSEERYLLVVDEENQTDMKEVTKILREDFIDGVIIYVPEEKVTSDYDIKIEESLDRLERIKGYGNVVIYLSGEAIEGIKEYDGEEIVFDNTMESLERMDIKNIGGIIKGEDSSKAPLLIACDYDYKWRKGESEDKGLLYNGSSIAANLEIARTLQENEVTFDRDTYFLFFNGSLSNKNKGTDGLLRSDFYKELDDNHFFIYLSDLGIKSSEKVKIDTSLLYSDTIGHYGLTNNIINRGKKLGFQMRREPMSYYDRGIRQLNSNGSSLVFLGGKTTDEDQTLKVIDKEKLRQQVQLIIDSITMYD